MSLQMVLDSALPRPGRRFEPIQELELHGAAIEAAGRLPNARSGLTVVRELVGPIGIPDFTALVGNQAALARRHSSNIAPVWNEIDAGIVSALTSTTGRSISRIADVLNWPIETVERRIGGLVRSRAISEGRPGRYTRDSRLGPIGRIYAIETKVDDWQSGLKQARTYRVWADSYVLVMGALSPRVLAKLVPEVQRDGGGLVVDGRPMLRPRLREVHPRRRIQASESFSAATEGLRLELPALACRIEP